MKSEEPISHAEAARDHLVTSLKELASDRDMGCSKYLWLAAREASIFAAQKQGWDVDTDDEIKDAVRWLDTEHGDQFEILSEFHTAEMFRNNADYGFLDKDEIIWFQPIVHEFVERMLALHTVEKDKLDADHNGTRR